MKVTHKYSWEIELEPRGLYSWTVAVRRTDVPCWHEDYLNGLIFLMLSSRETAIKKAHKYIGYLERTERIFV